MNSYVFVKFLGQGSYGEVQLVKHLLEEKEVRTNSCNDCGKWLNIESI